MATFDPQSLVFQAVSSTTTTAEAVKVLTSNPTFVANEGVVREYLRGVAKFRDSRWGAVRLVAETVLAPAVPPQHKVAVPPQHAAPKAPKAPKAVTAIDDEVGIDDDLDDEPETILRSRFEDPTGIYELRVVSIGEEAENLRLYSLSQGHWSLVMTSRWRETVLSKHTNLVKAKLAWAKNKRNKEVFEPVPGQPGRYLCFFRSKSGEAFPCVWVPHRKGGTLYRRFFSKKGEPFEKHHISDAQWRLVLEPRIVLFERLTAGLR